MTSIIIFSIFLLLTIIYIIYKLCIHDFVARDWAFVACAIFWSILLFFVIKEHIYGDYSDLITKYGMKHTGDKLRGEYTKDDLSFKHNDDNSVRAANYIITDKDNPDLHLHSYIINYFFDFSEGSIQTIYDYLKQNSKEYNENFEIIIKNKSCYLKVQYNYNNDTIIYNIKREKEYYFVDTGETSQKYKNPYYNKYKPYLEIKHYKEDYYEFDKDLIDLLFQEDIDNFSIDNYDNVIKYTFKAGE